MKFYDLKSPYSLKYKSPKKSIKNIPWNLLVYLQKVFTNVLGRTIYLIGYNVAFIWCIIKVPYDEFKIFVSKEKE